MGTPMVRSNCWWCCQCGKPDNKQSTSASYTCDKCSHGSCTSCLTNFNVGKARASSPMRYLSVLTDDPGVLFHVRAPPRRLRMYLESLLTLDVCADTGSDINCISLSFAMKSGSGIKKKGLSRVFRLPRKGESIRFIGKVRIRYSFLVELYMPQTCDFYVFKTLVCDVIAGRDFLRKTRTLDPHQDRLYELSNRIGRQLTVRSIGYSKEHVWCYLNGQTVLAVPDTGAEVNLISSERARILGYFAGPGGKQIRKEVFPTEVCLADSSSTISQRIIDLGVSFKPPAAISTLVHKLVDAIDISPTQAVDAITRRLGHEGIVYDSFHIINDLRDDVILGEQLLTTLDAYNQHRGNFSFSEIRHPSIAPFWIKKKGEGKIPSSVASQSSNGFETI